jgi:hypothetical protein
MPMVNGKEYPYTKKGMSQAKTAAKMSGKKMMDARKGAMMGYLKKK